MSEKRLAVSWIWASGDVQVGLVRPDGALALVSGDMNDIKTIFDIVLSKAIGVSDDVIKYKDQELAECTTMKAAYERYGVLLTELRKVAHDKNLIVEIATIAASNRKIRRQTIQHVSNKLN